MIPYFSLTQIPLGPITIQAWGLFVALGFIIGAAASSWLLKKRGLNSNVVWDLLGWLIIGSMVFARLFFVVFYDPSYFLVRPLEIFYLWQGGMSMIGGLFGATLAAAIYFRKKKLNWFEYSDTMIFGLPLGYAIGRFGCFLIHDHTGLPTSFLLGVRYLDGIVRHDLGLYHSLFGWLLFVLFFVLVKKKIRTGVLLVTFLFVYGVFRFFADFLRVGETHWLFLTPGQYFGLLMIISGLIISFKKKWFNYD
ncbi:MAG: prolipoprotein diacylglyceryl transferase [Candidatus Uhrbacteria bacterium]